MTAPANRWPIIVVIWLLVLAAAQCSDPTRADADEVTQTELCAELEGQGAEEDEMSDAGCWDCETMGNLICGVGAVGIPVALPAQPIVGTPTFTG